MEKLKRSLGSFVVPLLSIILAFVIGGIIMAALGANPFDAVKYLFQGAFGSKANIGTTLTKATPLMFTSLCACFAYKCGVFNLGGEGQFLMSSIAAFVTAYFSGVTGFAGVLLALLAMSDQNPLTNSRSSVDLQETLLTQLRTYGLRCLSYLSTMVG